MSADVLAVGWELQARPLTYRIANDSVEVTLQAQLRGPRPEELIGGLQVDSLVFLAHAGDLAAAGIDVTTANFSANDKVIDADAQLREYAVRSWRILYAGPDPAWLRAEVVG